MPLTEQTSDISRWGDIYLDAKAKSDRDSPYLPQSVIKQAFRDAEVTGITGELSSREDWIVWSPDSSDETLFVYIPDIAGNTEVERERMAELLQEAGVSTQRFINVHDGQKGSFDTGSNRSPDDDYISGNYGVKGGPGDGGPFLVDIDVDDYREATENEFVEKWRRESLAVKSPHTSHESPGHVYIAVDGDAREAVRDVTGRESVRNPVASFGEIRIDEQYCVGPGSAIICGCDTCRAEGCVGWYELARDNPPVTVSVEEFNEFLRSDKSIRNQGARTRGDSGSGKQSTGSGIDDSDDLKLDARLELAREIDDYVAEAFEEVKNPDDRSRADARLARSVAPWLAYDKDEIKSVIDDHGTVKWDQRGDSYRASIINWALDRKSDNGVDAYGAVPDWADIGDSLELFSRPADDPRRNADEALAAWFRARAAGAFPENASPPRRVLKPVVESLTGVDPDRHDIHDGVWEEAEMLLGSLSVQEAADRFDVEVGESPS